MIDEDENGDRNTTRRRLRKTRLLQSGKSRAIDTQSKDLPTFLVNSDLALRMADSTSYESSKPQNPVSAFLTRIRDAVTLRYLAAKERLIAYMARPIRPSLLSRRGNLGILGMVLIASVLPLVLFMTSGRAPHTAKKAEPISQTLLPLPPEFELEQRLAFAGPLGDRMLSHALEQSFDQSTSSEPNKRSGETIPSEEKTAGLIVTDAGAATPQTLAEDRNLSLSFNSQSFMPTTLPKTAQDSFVAELAMSNLMAASVERPRIAENDAPAAASSSKAKPKKVAARKRVIASKKRPARVNQMTASTAPPPVAIQEQPNLPPPPILFFLGAPPAPSQPGQP